MNIRDEVFFITICCRGRHRNQLAQAEIWPFLVESIEHRLRERIWWPDVFLVMPDHCHAFLTFPAGHLFQKTIELWKRWVATQLGVRWQVGFFDHRLRNEAAYREKLDYILQNPRRAGLVAKAADWPYVWHPRTSVPFTGFPR